VVVGFPGRHRIPWTYRANAKPAPMMAHLGILLTEAEMLTPMAGPQVPLLDDLCLFSRIAIFGRCLVFSCVGSMAPSHGITIAVGMQTHGSNVVKLARIHMNPIHNTSMDDAVSFSSLQRYATNMGPKRRSPATPPGDLATVFQAALAHCRMVSFDVFDTLLVRYVHHPRDVFLHLEKTAPFRRQTRWPAPLWQLRQKAENHARRKLHQATGSAEVTLSEIYVSFCELTQWKDPVAELVQAEEEIELKLCRPCPAIGDLYALARAGGKPVIFVSDTYHHAQFVCEMLTANGFPAAPGSVFASSDLRLNKQSGQLFPKVVQRIGLPPAAILHIGDHPISDFQQPQAVGIKAILHDHRASAVHPAKAFALPTAALQTSLSGFAAIASRCHRPARDFWWLLGYNVCGPLLTGFCLWLERCFHADEITRAWFLLRDGEIFERVYRTLLPGPEAIPTATLPSSRRAFLLPVLESAPKLAMRGLMSGVGPRPVREYLERLNLPAESFRAEFAASGFANLDEIIDGRHEGERLFRLVRQPRIQTAILERSRLEKELLLAFFGQEGLRTGRKIALVDLGWRGSVHKAAHLLLSRPGHPANLVGYYLATSAGFANDMAPGLSARGFLMHEGKPEATAQRISQFPQLLEILCSGVTGSLLHFERAADRIQGVFQEPDASTMEYAHWR
jgi:FMN phosphatase YigB (HAD superfamily)